MQTLAKRVHDEARYLGRGIIKVDGFLNHQLDPLLTEEMGQIFQKRLEAEGVRDVTKILTVEVSGIAPALATGRAYGVPVVYARKKRPITMSEPIYSAQAPSHTKGEMATLMVSADYLSAKDRVVIIDDFLATGQTLDALITIIQQSGATLLGIGAVIEKAFEDGRQRLTVWDVPIISLVTIDLDQDQLQLR